MKPTKISTIDESFSFGKYKGELIKQVALFDPDYIEWLCKEVENFLITDEIIDALSDYCLSEFFNDPELYLAQTGTTTTLLRYQHLKFGDKEMILGAKNPDFALTKIKGLPFDNSYQNFSRKVFNGETCKKMLKVRVTRNNSEYENEEYASNAFSDEDLRIMYNDAYEIDSNEMEGWFEPID